MTSEAERLFSEGKSVNAVASALGTTWWEAKKMKREFDSANGIAVMPKKLAKKKPAPEPEPEPEEPDEWSVSINVPTARLDDIFATFTAQEKADAIAGVLQSRIDAALEVA